jgi:hypothetical protein
MFACLCSGTGGTTFKGNQAEDSGGDIVVYGGMLNVTGATLSAATASEGASIFIADNSTVFLDRVVLTNATSTVGSGGCITATERSFLQITRSLISKCHATKDGGGINMDGEAQVVLINTNINDNTAGINNGGQAHSWAVGGGVMTQGSSTLTLEGARFQRNSAMYGGGGMALRGDGTLTVRGKPSLFHQNNAGTVGGGLRFYSSYFEPMEVSRLVIANNNTAPSAANIAYASWDLTVVDSGNAAEFITSDSKDGVLRVKLNISGPHGLPSDDDIVYTGYDSNNQVLFSQAVRGIGKEIKEVPISFKRPPGVLQQRAWLQRLVCFAWNVLAGFCMRFALKLCVGSTWELGQSGVKRHSCKGRACLVVGLVVYLTFCMACYCHIEALWHHWVTHALPCHHHLATFGKNTCSKLFVAEVFGLLPGLLQAPTI